MQMITGIVAYGCTHAHTQARPAHIVDHHVIVWVPLQLRQVLTSFKGPFTLSVRNRSQIEYHMCVEPTVAVNVGLNIYVDKRNLFASRSLPYGSFKLREIEGQEL